jgi:hypothetical protein
MSRILSMGVICLVLSTAAGCKGTPANRGADRATGAGSGLAPRAALQITRGQVTRRDDGTMAVSSPDGTQVMLLKQTEVDGKQVGWYQVCDATGTMLRCGDWTRIDSPAPCTLCVFEPCPCTNPACASVCKPL